MNPNLSMQDTKDNKDHGPRNYDDDRRSRNGISKGKRIHKTLCFSVLLFSQSMVYIEL